MGVEYIGFNVHNKKVIAMSTISEIREALQEAVMMEYARSHFETANVVATAAHLCGATDDEVENVYWNDMKDAATKNVTN